MYMRKIIKLALLIAYIATNTTLESHTLTDPQLDNPKRFETLYAQYTLHIPIKSDNPKADITLLQEHIAYLTQEKTSLEQFTLHPTVYKLARIYLIIDIASGLTMNLWGRYNNIQYTPIHSIIINTSIGILCMKPLFYYATKLQKRSAKIEKINKQINVDETIIKQLRKTLN